MLNNRYGRILCFMTVLSCSRASGEERPPFQVPVASRQFRSELRTWRDVSSQNVVMQAREYTCGAASLATIMQYVYGENITEQQILAEVVKKLKSDELIDREKNGLSMEDLARSVSALGFAAAVLEIDHERLVKLPVPAIVCLTKDDFKHFVVYRGEKDRRVFVADPLRGNVRLPSQEFAEQWDKKVLAIVKRGELPPKVHKLQLNYDMPARPELQAARRGILLPAPRPQR